MVVVAVAGGLGDFGRLIVDALLAKDKYEVYVLTRKVCPMPAKLFITTQINQTWTCRLFSSL